MTCCSAAITASEVDYFTFLAPSTGNYRLAAATPSSTLNTVLGVYNAVGGLAASNDDIVPGSNTDSAVTVALTGGITLARKFLKEQ